MGNGGFGLVIMTGQKARGVGHGISAVLGLRAFRVQGFYVRARDARAANLLRLIEA